MSKDMQLVPAVMTLAGSKCPLLGSVGGHGCSWQSQAPSKNLLPLQRMFVGPGAFASTASSPWNVREIQASLREVCQSHFLQKVVSRKLGTGLSPVERRGRRGKGVVPTDNSEGIVQY